MESTLAVTFFETAPVDREYLSSTPIPATEKPKSSTNASKEKESEKINFYNTSQIKRAQRKMKKDGEKTSGGLSKGQLKKIKIRLSKENKSKRSIKNVTVHGESHIRTNRYFDLKSEWGKRALSDRYDLKPTQSYPGGRMIFLKTN